MHGDSWQLQPHLFAATVFESKSLAQAKMVQTGGQHANILMHARCNVNSPNRPFTMHDVMHSSNDKLQQQACQL